DQVLAAADLLPDRVRRIEIGARLVDIRQLHRVADLQGAAVRRLFARDHAEERRLAGAVRAHHTDDACGRQRERQVLDEPPVAEAFLPGFGVDPEVAEPRTRRDVDLNLVELHVLLLGEQLLVGAEARLRLRVARARAHAYPLELTRERAPACGLLLLLHREP